MSCQNCQSNRILTLSSKASDLHHWSCGNRSCEGYLPDEFNDFLGSGDYVSLNVCLDCGRLAGQFPVPELDIEKEREKPSYFEFRKRTISRGGHNQTLSQWYDIEYVKRHYSQDSENLIETAEVEYQNSNQESGTIYDSQYNEWEWRAIF